MGHAGPCNRWSLSCRGAMRYSNRLWSEAVAWTASPAMSVCDAGPIRTLRLFNLHHVTRWVTSNQGHNLGVNAAQRATNCGPGCFVPLAHVHRRLPRDVSARGTGVLRKQLLGALRVASLGELLLGADVRICARRWFLRCTLLL